MKNVQEMTIDEWLNKLGYYSNKYGKTTDKRCYADYFRKHNIDKNCITTWKREQYSVIGNDENGWKLVTCRRVLNI